MAIKIIEEGKPSKPIYLGEFKIKGKIVLAYSKKDAIKRLKHRSK